LRSRSPARFLVAIALTVACWIAWERHAKAADVAGPVLTRESERAIGALFRGDFSASQCAWTGTSIDRNRVVARFTCASRPTPVTLELRHPSTADPVLARSRHFAIVSSDPQPPPASLVELMRQRIETIAQPISWAVALPVGSAPLPAAAVVPPDSKLRSNALVALAALLLAVLSIAPAIARRSPRIAAPVVGLAVGGLARLALSATGYAIVLSALHIARCRWLAALLAAAAIFAIAGITFAWTRRKRDRIDVVAAVAAGVLTIAVPYAMSIRDARVQLARQVRFAGLVASRPGDATENDPRRPRVRYHFNSRGLRGPEFRDGADPGTVRVAIIGDSFVTGLGVEWPDTLGEQLRNTLVARGLRRPIEVLNLGMPGDNLPDHADEYIAIRSQLHPDLVVLSLTLWNDASDWSIQDEYAHSARPSVFSAVRSLLGDSFAGWAYLLRYGGWSREPRTVSVVRTQLARIAADRRAHGDVPLLIYTWSTPHPDVDEATSAWAHTRVAPFLEAREGFAIPNDGHPSAAGVRASAELLAGVITGDPDLARAAGFE
jgi:lysophospholipase L1-like esterase